VRAAVNLKSYKFKTGATVAIIGAKFKDAKSLKLPRVRHVLKS